MRVGLDAKLYYNTGTYATPAWVEMTNAQDVTIDLQADEADSKRRGSIWSETLIAHLKGSVNFDLAYDNQDAVFDDFQAAYFGRTPVEMAVMDGDITTSGSKGLRATMAVTNFKRNEPLSNQLTSSVTVKPTPAANPPEWMKVA